MFIVACAGAIVAGTRAQPADYDLLIANGRVLDGTGNPCYIADVAVKAGRIARSASCGTRPRGARPTPGTCTSRRDGQTMDGLDATRETIEVGEQSGARVMATHFKFLGKGFWGASVAALRLIDEAPQRGVQIYLDT